MNQFDGLLSFIFTKIFQKYASISTTKENMRSRLMILVEFHSFHSYASLLTKITSLLDHLSDLVFKHVFREGNVCANFLPRLGRNSTLGVTI